MLVIPKINELRAELGKSRSQGKTIILVPTMGNLHTGHLKLVTQAKSQGDLVVATIFVNPLQFGAGEDLEAYPRSFNSDRNKLEQAGCHCLFSPDANEIYPDGAENQTIVSVAKLAVNYCGMSRPGHFEGVATVVSKLFNIAQPNKAVFGLKDYQQFLIIKKMVYDLKFPIEIIGVETHRESNGLAMSSRNNYLSAEQRKNAGIIYQSLQATAKSMRTGLGNYSELEQQAMKMIEQAGLTPDYFAICQADTLEPAQAEDKELVLLAAAYSGPARLIDNLRVSL